MEDEELNEKIDKMIEKFDEVNKSVREIAISFERLIDTLKWLK